MISRRIVFSLFFLAVFLQSGTYGLTFMLPMLFAEFGGNEKDVGAMLAVTSVVTLFSVYYSGHLTDRFGRMVTLGVSGYAITIALYLYSISSEIGLELVVASGLLGFGWGTMYTLAPVVLTRVSGSANRVQIFSLFAVFMMAGFGLSPVYASLLERFGFGVRDAFSTVAVLCLVSGSIFLGLRSAIRRLSDQSTPDNRSSLSVRSVVAVMKTPGWLPIVMVCIGASVFAGMNNFQTVFAGLEGQNYAEFFLAYTVTVVVCRLALAGFSGGKSPYKVIALLQYVMFASVILFIFVDGSHVIYIASAVLFGIGYGASYPVLAAMAANDADPDLVPQTLQLFALTYFVGIFGFPFLAGWIIVDFNVEALLIGIAVLALIEATMAWLRHRSRLAHN
ncbi:MAG: MFS transporter [Pseudomonadota bacterium]